MKHVDRLGPRDVAILMRGREELGPGPCDICCEYTASRYGVHTGCVARKRRIALANVRHRLEAIVVARARARQPAPASSGDERRGQ
jgi:hypothetical protein